MNQYGFYFDQSRCYACHACSVACKDWNGIGPGPEKWMTVYEWEEGAFMDIRVHTLALSCGHCENPLCVAACSNKALFKDEKYGTVLVDQEKCKGSRQCAVVCPYGSPKFADDAPGTKMSKCTMCLDRLEKGEIPICVASCPLRALDFGPIQELETKYGSLRQLPGMPEPASRPALIFKKQTPKKEILPYDKQKALKLMQKRGDLGMAFENIEDVNKPEKERMARNSLKMKHASVKDLMAETRNDIG